MAHSANGGAQLQDPSLPGEAFSVPLGSLSALPGSPVRIAATTPVRTGVRPATGDAWLFGAAARGGTSQPSLRRPPTPPSPGDAPARLDAPPVLEPTPPPEWGLRCGSEPTTSLPASEAGSLSNTVMRGLDGGIVPLSEPTLPFHTHQWRPPSQGTEVYSIAALFAQPAEQRNANHGSAGCGGISGSVVPSMAQQQQGRAYRHRPPARPPPPPPDPDECETSPPLPPLSASEMQTIMWDMMGHAGPGHTSVSSGRLGMLPDLVGSLGQVGRVGAPVGMRGSPPWPPWPEETLAELTPGIATPTAGGSSGTLCGGNRGLGPDNASTGEGDAGSGDVNEAAGDAAEPDPGSRDWWASPVAFLFGGWGSGLPTFTGCTNASISSRQAGDCTPTCCTTTMGEPQLLTRVVAQATPASERRAMDTLRLLGMHSESPAPGVATAEPHPTFPPQREAVPEVTAVVAETGGTQGLSSDPRRVAFADAVKSDSRAAPTEDAATSATAIREASEEWDRRMDSLVKEHLEENHEIRVRASHGIRQLAHTNPRVEEIVGRTQKACLACVDAAIAEPADAAEAAADKIAFAPVFPVPVLLPRAERALLHHSPCAGFQQPISQGGLLQPPSVQATEPAARAAREAQLQRPVAAKAAHFDIAQQQRERAQSADDGGTCCSDSCVPDDEVDDRPHLALEPLGGGGKLIQLNSRDPITIPAMAGQRNHERSPLTPKQRPRNPQWASLSAPPAGPRSQALSRTGEQEECQQQQQQQQDEGCDEHPVSGPRVLTNDESTDGANTGGSVCLPSDKRFLMASAGPPQRAVQPEMAPLLQSVSSTKSALQKEQLQWLTQQLMLQQSQARQPFHETPPKQMERVDQQQQKQHELPTSHFPEHREQHEPAPHQVQQPAPPMPPLEAHRHLQGAQRFPNKWGQQRDSAQQELQPTRLPNLPQPCIVTNHDVAMDAGQRRGRATRRRDEVDAAAGEAKETGMRAAWYGSQLRGLSAPPTPDAPTVPPLAAAKAAKNGTSRSVTPGRAGSDAPSPAGILHGTDLWRQRTVSSRGRTGSETPIANAVA